MTFGFRSIIVAFIITTPVFSQTAPPADPLKALPPGWEQIDQRLVFLTIELSNVETSLAAVNKAIRVNGYNQSVKQNQAQTARRGNEAMDRNAGGPVAWDKFYGRTAEKFFYHPVDPNTHYGTITELHQTDPKRDVSAGEGIPSRQGLPLQQRPPQFDYIYRANLNAAQRAEQEAAALGNKIGPLTQRRHQLEAEQSSLWCKISFQALASRKLSKKPIYRFGLRSSATDKKNVERLEACKASAEFVGQADRLATQAMEGVDQNQAGTLIRLHDGIAQAYHDLDKKLEAQRQLAGELVDQTSPLGKVYALSSRMDDMTKNLIDALKLSEDGEKAKDDQRKNTFRALVQESLLTYAEAVLTMDQNLSELTAKWGVTPDPDLPSPDLNVASKPIESMPKAGLTAPTQAAVDVRRTDEAARRTGGNVVDLLQGSLGDVWESAVPVNGGFELRSGVGNNWTLNGGLLANPRFGPSLVTKQRFADFSLHLEFNLPRGCNSGVYLRGRYEIKLCDGINRYNQTCGAILARTQLEPTKNAYIGRGQWNTLDATLIGKTISVVMNGVRVIDERELSGPLSSGLDTNEDAPGPIFLHSHQAGTGAKFRNIVVTPLAGR